MTLAKATVSGTVYREPQDRSTQNGVEIWDFVLSLDDNSETLVRVISLRRALADLLRGVRKGDKLLVDGRLQVGSSKTSNGTEKKYFEIVANDIELMTGLPADSASVPDSQPAVQPQPQQEEIVTFAETDFTEENLLDEDEVPF